jgi:D-glycero-beta-D-manno-heptose 1-phosphate adenylyltransferase
MRNGVQNILNKIVTRSGAQTLVASWKQQQKRVVFTNGCFDIIHKGHIFFLAKAKEKGDMLIVGVNSDDSVRRLKGQNRPVKEEESRLITMAAFECVDAVVCFNEDTPEQLITELIPNVLIKGKDYEIKDIVGADFVISHGGSVETIDLETGFSSTNYINKL